MPAFHQQLPQEAAGGEQRKMRMPSMWAKVLAAWALKVVIDPHAYDGRYGRVKSSAVDGNSAGAQLLNRSPGHTGFIITLIHTFSIPNAS